MRRAIIGVISNGEIALATLKYSDRQEIIAQALREIQFAREYKQGKTKNWKINEDLYYGRKFFPEAARANVDLGQGAAFVHTILSKIDTPLVFKFIKRKESQMKRVKQLNALRTSDQSKDDWDIKDIVGKKQAVIYGRAIYSYYADSVDGYEAHLDNVDVYDFLVDPAAGGIDLERAMYLGSYGVVKSRDQLKQGIKDGIYLKTETNTLLEGDGNSATITPEVQNQDNRAVAAQSTWKSERNIGDKDKFVFWNWGTTWQGKRYYLLINDKLGNAIEVTPLEEKFQSELWWYWTWAAFPDLTEFWTPSFFDYVREVFMAQAVSINQLLDNAEQINKPQKVVNVSAIENLAELYTFRRNGIIKTKNQIDANKAVQIIETPTITTPIQVFNLLDQIQEKASGVTAAQQGAAQNGGDQKATIYKGNEENSADRFGYLNKSYSFGYKRFAKLYVWGVKEHLVKKIAIDILGPDGVEIQMISRRDIFRKDEEFNIMVESSTAETALSEQEKEAKLSFLSAQAAIITPPGQKPVQNPQKAYELQASIVGFDEDTIRQLQDTSNFGDADLMSEAERDIERILDGEIVKPNQIANTAYKQRFVDYMQDNQENISFEQFTMLANYVLLLDPIIARNMTRQANDLLMQQNIMNAQNPQPIDPNAPIAPGQAPQPQPLPVQQ